MAAAPQQQPQQTSSSSAEQRAPLFTSGVLPVMLQHPAISSDRKTVCRLLCSSKALRSAVLQHASGMVELFIREGFNLQPLHSWLSHHGHLLKALTMDGDLSLADAARLACALQVAAAATPGGLRLQEFGAFLPSTAAGLVLQQLPRQHLTELCLTRSDVVQLPGAAAQQLDPCVQQTAWALAGLTNLSILSLHGELEEDNTLAPWLDPILPLLPFSGFSCLTQLHLSGCSKGRLSLLPQQLVELTVYHVTAQPAEQLQLGHLTALTRFQYGPACVQAGDMLPPNLLNLEIPDCSATGPLAALTRLTRLELQWMSGSMSVAGLVSGIAGRLQYLQELWVTIDHKAGDGAAHPSPASAVWPAAAAGAVLPALGPLCLQKLPGSMFVTAADAISRLSSITGLSVLADRNQQDDAALAALARAIAALPRLQFLLMHCVGFGRSPVAVEVLSGAATSLTSLKVMSAGLSDLSVSRMFAFGLTGLKSLDICTNSDVSLGSLLFLVACLPQLTALADVNRNGGRTEANAACRRQIESVLEQRRQAARQ